VKRVALKWPVRRIQNRDMYTRSEHRFMIIFITIIIIIIIIKNSPSARYKLSSYLNKEVTVRFRKLNMQLWDSMC
jgi:hypothetical protein